VSEVGEQMRKSGWRQGVILPAAQLLKNLPDGQPVTNDHYLLAVSQSCDLVHHDLEKEPYAVFLVLEARESIVPEFTHGRNPRVLHFSGVAGRFFEAWAWRQVAMPRGELLKHRHFDMEMLSEPDLRVVVEWLAKRFTRIAFPDDFNEALRPQGSTIKKALKRSHHLFSEILLRLEPFDNLTTSSVYHISCYFLMPSEIHDDPGQLADARAMAVKLEECFLKCGIEVFECAPISELDLSYAELKELVRWDYDYLTYRADSEKP